MRYIFLHNKTKGLKIHKRNGGQFKYQTHITHKPFALLIKTLFGFRRGIMDGEQLYMVDAPINYTTGPAKVPRHTIDKWMRDAFHYWPE